MVALSLLFVVLAHSSVCFASVLADEGNASVQAQKEANLENGNENRIDSENAVVLEGSVGHASKVKQYLVDVAPLAVSILLVAIGIEIYMWIVFGQMRGRDLDGGERASPRMPLDTKSLRTIVDRTFAKFDEFSFKTKYAKITVRPEADAANIEKVAMLSDSEKAELKDRYLKEVKRAFEGSGFNGMDPINFVAGVPGRFSITIFIEPKGGQIS